MSIGMIIFTATVEAMGEALAVVDLEVDLEEALEEAPEEELEVVLGVLVADLALEEEQVDTEEASVVATDMETITG